MSFNMPNELFLKVLKERLPKTVEEGGLQQGGQVLKLVRTVQLQNSVSIFFAAPISNFPSKIRRNKGWIKAFAYKQVRSGKSLCLY